jgi:hypothetical protein
MKEVIDFVRLKTKVCIASPLYIISRKNFKNESYTPKGHVLIK